LIGRVSKCAGEKTPRGLYEDCKRTSAVTIHSPARAADTLPINKSIILYKSLASFPQSNHMISLASAPIEERHSGYNQFQQSLATKIDDRTGSSYSTEGSTSSSSEGHTAQEMSEQDNVDNVDNGTQPKKLEEHNTGTVETVTTTADSAVSVAEENGIDNSADDTEKTPPTRTSSKIAPGRTSSFPLAQSGALTYERHRTVSDESLLSLLDDDSTVSLASADSKASLPSLASVESGDAPSMNSDDSLRKTLESSEKTLESSDSSSLHSSASNSLHSSNSKSINSSNGGKASLAGYLERQNNKLAEVVAKDSISLPKMIARKSAPDLVALGKESLKSDGIPSMPRRNVEAESPSNFQRPNMGGKDVSMSLSDLSGNIKGRRTDTAPCAPVRNRNERNALVKAQSARQLTPSRMHVHRPNDFKKDLALTNITARELKAANDRWASDTIAGRGSSPGTKGRLSSSSKKDRPSARKYKSARDLTHDLSLLSPASTGSFSKCDMSLNNSSISDISMSDLSSNSVDFFAGRESAIPRMLGLRTKQQNTMLASSSSSSLLNSSFKDLAPNMPARRSRDSQPPRKMAPAPLANKILARSVDHMNPYRQAKKSVTQKEARLLQVVPNLQQEEAMHVMDSELLGSDGYDKELSEPDFFGGVKMPAGRGMSDGLALEDLLDFEPDDEAEEEKPKKKQPKKKKKIKVKLKKGSSSKLRNGGRSTPVRVESLLEEQLFILLNHDPWGEKVLFDDGAIREVIEEDYRICERMYKFESIDDDSTYPLSMLCALGADVDTVRLCYDAYTEALAYNEGWIGTPLHYACAYQAPLEVVRFLVAKRPRLAGTVNRMGRSPMHLLCMMQPTKAAVKVLMKHDKDVLIKGDLNGMLPLHHACDSGASAEVIAMLIKVERDSCIYQSDQGYIPLHLAILRQSPLSVLEILINEYEQTLNVMDNQGNLALHLALNVPTSLECMALLKNKFPRGAWSKNKLGHTPIDLATWNRKDDHALLELLETE
jgi:hypothetical protein